MNQISEDLRKAVEILDARGWCQGAHEMPDGRVCAEAAVIRAVVGDEAVRLITRQMRHLVGYLYEQPYSVRVFDAFEALVRHKPGHAGSVHGYNDDPMTSVEDVKLMFKRAIEEEEAKP